MMMPQENSHPEQSGTEQPGQSRSAANRKAEDDRIDEDVFDSQEEGVTEGSDTAILRGEKKFLWEPLGEEKEPADSPLQPEASQIPEGGQTESASESPEELLELPEDELLDLPASENFRVVSNSDDRDVSLEPARFTTALPAEDSLMAETSEAGMESTEAIAEPSLETAPVEPSDTTSTGEASLEAGQAEEVSVAEQTQRKPASLELAETAEEESPMAAETASVEEQSAPTEVTIPEILAVRLPDDERWVPLSELIVQITGQPLGEGAARWITRLYLKSLQEPDTGGEVGETPADVSTAEAGGFSFVPVEASGSELDYRERVKKGRPTKSLLGEIVGIVLGGLGGLLIAYYALNFFGGKQYDFANIPLPGIKHTYRHLPPWAKNWFESQDTAHPVQEGDQPGPTGN